MPMEILNHSKKNGLGLLMEKYEHFAQDVQETLFENKKALTKLKRATEEALFDGGEKLKDVAVEAHRKVKKNPWAYIGAISSAALLLGFVIGKKQ